MGHNSPVFPNNMPTLVWPQLQQDDMKFLIMYLDFASFHSTGHQSQTPEEVGFSRSSPGISHYSMEP